jgi:hypothetical protein
MYHFAVKNPISPQLLQKADWDGYQKYVWLKFIPNLKLLIRNFSAPRVGAVAFYTVLRAVVIK